MITQIFEDPKNPIHLEYEYSTDSAYDVNIKRTENSWSFQLQIKTFPELVAKRSSTTLFDSIVENARCFKYTLDGQDVGYLQLGHQTWNNRMRIWDFLIDSKWRRRGIGTEFMNLAKSEALNVGARMLVLETQSCNIPAINFYLKHGFQLIGFDLAHYSNEDIRRHEFRLEFGLELPVIPETTIVTSSES